MIRTAGVAGNATND